MKTVDILAIGAHPDDVELACGGTLALLAERGRRVGILHLTRGEAGTRGTAKEREGEAERAAAELGATAIEFLDCGDGGLRTGPAEEDALIAVLRRLAPELVLGPPPADRHPDHDRAYRLVKAACFYAGLAKRGGPGRTGQGGPHRPAALWSYMQHDPFEPSFIVDVTRSWDAKLKALACYESQLHQPGQPDQPDQPGRRGSRDEPQTKVSSPEYRLAVDGRARHYGLLIGAAYGEPFWSPLPMAVADPWALVPKGLR